LQSQSLTAVVKQKLPIAKGASVVTAWARGSSVTVQLYEEMQGSEYEVALRDFWFLVV